MHHGKPLCLFLLCIETKALPCWSTVETQGRDAGTQPRCCSTVEQYKWIEEQQNRAATLIWKGSHAIVFKTFSHTGDHTILSLSPNYFPPLICFWDRQVTPSIEGEKFLEWTIDRDSCNDSSHGN